MRVLFVIAVFVAAALAADTIDVTDETFEETIKGELVLVKFYAPWCGHCKKLAPEWESAATLVKGKAVLANLDATVQTKSAEKFGIRGYPTIKIFRNGEMRGDYDGGRTADAIAKWVNGNSGPAISVVASKEEFDAMKAANSVLAVLFAQSETPEYKAFETIANQLRGTYKFAQVTDSDLADEGTLVVYKHFDNKRDVFSGDAKEPKEIAKFIASSGTRLFDEIGPENYKMYVDRKLPMGWLFVKPNDADTESVKKAVEDIAPRFAGKMSLIWIDADKYGGMAQRLGLPADKFPAFAIDNDGQHFAFSEEKITSESVQKFLDNYLGGELKATLRSEKAPESHTVDGLTTVVGTTFNELVLSDTHDVLIEFYAPWCGHCKKLAPEYKKVASLMKDVEGLRVAQIDATSNDFDQKLFNVQGFPTLYFVAKGTRDPVPYEGPRTADGIVSFLKKKSSASVPEGHDDL